MGLHPANRAAVYGQLLSEMPSYWSTLHSSWILTRYSDVSAVMRNPQAMALDAVPFLGSLSQRSGIDLSRLLSFLSSLLLLMRPPRHDAVRKLLAQVLGNFRRTSLPALLEARAERLLASGAREGSIDLAAGYGQTLALFAIGTILGLPEEDLGALGAISNEFMEVFERRLPSVSRLIELNRQVTALMEYFERLIARRRRESGEDGLSTLVRLSDSELACNDEELAGFCTFFFIAGEETTRAGISEAMLMLLERPALRAQLSAQPEKIPGAAREFIRLASPVQYVVKEMGADLQVDSLTIRTGEPVILMLGAANRDPAVFPNPNEPDPDRNGPESVAFAVGPYRCVGAQLATFEIDLAVRKLLAWPGLRLSSEQPVWVERMNIAPLRHLMANYS
ncbi:MAG TPA: cytochrome P450 [Rhizomicrobium sp.]|nr:cytochrome P450 [Rhizomicrobium sp.]